LPKPTTVRASRAASGRSSPRARRPARAHWTRLPDEALLQLRFRDLGLRTIERRPLKRAIRRLHGDLKRRGIEFRPHFWFGEEWFSPDGVPGVAIPFYLAHPRLERLERRMMNEVEGGNANWLIRILRHEAGHAVDTAYRLRRRALWREAFGPASLPYPDKYRARPGSRRYVHHLGGWYAQAHPTEDFAETFAVWLKPNSAWRRSYAGWPALQKLEVVEDLMQREVRGRTPLVRSRAHIEPVAESTETLASYYRRRAAARVRYRRGLADELLQRVFTSRPARADVPRAAAFLRGARKSLVAAVVRELGVERYDVWQMLRMAIERSEKLDLHLRGSRRDAQRHARWVIERLLRIYKQIESPHQSL
jgi:hypothetical protein